MCVAEIAVFVCAERERERERERIEMVNARLKSSHPENIGKDESIYIRIKTEKYEEKERKKNREMC